MKNNFEVSFALLLKEEGGFVNDPQDSGGMTNLGVTKEVWDQYTGQTSSEDDMRKLSPAQVYLLYYTEYWKKVSGDDLPTGVDYAVFDFGVNSGTGEAVRVLQECVGVNPDGVIGPVTLAAIRAANPVDLCNEICDKRLFYLQSLHGWAHDGNGWGNRVAYVKGVSASMAGRG